MNEIVIWAEINRMKWMTVDINKAALSNIRIQILSGKLSCLKILTFRNTVCPVPHIKDT